MFINLFCALSYFAKILESMTDKGAGFAPFTTIQYLDYCFTWYVFARAVPSSSWRVPVALGALH